MSRTLRTIEQRTGASTLMVLLPGAYMRPEDYVDAGFFRRAAEQQPSFDLIAVDLDLDQISSGSALPALQAEIIEPSRQRGYSRIWLGGISLGGMLALSHNADTPGSVDGLCLLAPYPGSRLTTNAIARTGGLSHWQATPDQLKDPEFRAWQWLQKPPADFPVFVGYGSEDRFAEGMRQIAGCFPADASFAVPGGHEWPVWQVLWEHFLTSKVFQR